MTSFIKTYFPTFFKNVFGTSNTLIVFYYILVIIFVSLFVANVINNMIFAYLFGITTGLYVLLHILLIYRKAKRIKNEQN